jgi:hypothetical protein
MTESHIANLSALLELGEKSLNEGDYVKLANFLKGLRDSQPPNLNPFRSALNHIEVTVEFETLLGAPMRVCIHKEKYERFHGATPDRRTVWGSINGNELELPFEQFRDKLIMIYDIYGMRNIKKTVPYCEPMVYKTVGDFKCITHTHQIESYANPEAAEDDINPDDWAPSWLVKCVFSLETDIPA